MNTNPQALSRLSIARLQRINNVHIRNIITTLQYRQEMSLIRCSHAGQEWLEYNGLTMASIVVVDVFLDDRTIKKTIVSGFTVNSYSKLILVNLFNPMETFVVLECTNMLEVVRSVSANELADLVETDNQ